MVARLKDLSARGQRPFNITAPMEWAYTIEVFRESGQPFDTWPGLPLPYSLNEGKVFAHNDCEVEVLQVVKQALGGDPPLGEPGHVKARLVHDFIEERLLEKIRSELVRLGAGEEPGLGDAIKVSRRERGRVDLQDVLSRPEEDFLWVGPGAEALAVSKACPTRRVLRRCAPSFRTSALARAGVALVEFSRAGRRAELFKRVQLVKQRLELA